MQLITLKDPAANSCVQIAPERGAIVTSFAVGTHELLYMDPTTLTDRSKNVRGGIPILFPIAGKLANDQWQVGDRKGAMPQHGFARQLAWQVTSQSESAVSLSLQSNVATLAQYPWPCTAGLTYSLAGGCLRTTLRITNTGKESLPYALGYHPYFAVTDKRRALVSTEATRVFNNLSKQVEPFKGVDFTQAEVDLHLLDHRQASATLELEDRKIIVRASDDFGVWVLWTLAGKEFVCLEPWTAPGNALNSGERLIHVAPGDTHESWVSIDAHERVKFA
jgi:galactose mutarotase-like enzyme